MAGSRRKGIDNLLSKLKEVDPLSAEKFIPMILKE